jgi:pimeloyl-ACP methyl ester carboxylesterase
MRDARRAYVPATLAVCAALAATACTPSLSIEAQGDAARARRGAVASVEAVGGYPDWVLRTLIWSQGLSDAIPTQYGVSLYRVVYWTPAPDGRLVRASGLVAFPRSDALRGVVSFQHGTASERSAAPSTPDPNNGVVAAAVFAGHGYLLVAPDYLGFGASREPHPYYHAPSTASAVVDLLRASRVVVGAAGFAWPDSLYLVGFSQGGHATLATQRALEAEPDACLPLRASASLAGPIDLAGVQFPAALQGRSRFASLYVAWIANSYARIYAMPLDSVIREPYASQLATLFDGAHGGDAIVAALPKQPRDMLAPAFLSDYDAGRATWFVARLAENGLLDWTPRAPIRLYYGDADVDVAPADARSAAAAFASRGSDVRAISVGARDHEGSLLAAVPQLRAWFDEVGATPQPGPAEARARCSVPTP